MSEYQDLWEAANAVFRGKYIALKMLILEKKSLKLPEKIKHKVSRRKKIIRMKAKANLKKSQMLVLWKDKLKKFLTSLIRIKREDSH